MAEEDSAKRDSKVKKALSSAGAETRKEGAAMMQQAEAESDSRSDEKSPNSSPRFYDSYKRGGKVRKSGRARLHKGEVVKRKRKRYSGRL